MEKNNLIEGPISKSIIFLAVPILLANLLQAAYNIIDTFWVGRLGAEAVAAVSLSFPVIFLIITLSGGVGLGGAVLVSQYKGKGNLKKVNHVTGQVFLLAFSVSIILSFIGYLIAPWIITTLGAEAEVIPSAISYLRYSFLGMIFVFGYMVFQSVSRGAGDAKTPLYIVLGTVLLNVILDPLFIFGWKFIPAMGVTGAAMATIITQGLALFVAMGLLLTNRHRIKLSFNCFKPNKYLIKKIVKLGIPVSLEQSSRSFGFLIMTAIVASFGTITLAAYGIGMRIFSIIIIPALSLSIANSALVGQNIGANNVNRAEKISKTSAKIGFISLTIIGVLFLIFARQLSTIFIPGDLNVINTSTMFIRIIALSFGFIAVQMAFNGTLRGSGNTGVTMKIAFSVMVIQLSLAIILSRYFLGEVGLWLSMPIANIIGAGIAYSIFKSGKWKEKKIIE